jgi:deferrochelatase/peroxidase EfeB
MDQPIRKGASRRGFLGAAAGTVGGAMLARTARATPPPPMQGPDLTTEPFFGPHQGGIATRPQKHVYFATFDIVTDKRGEVEGLLRQWSAAAARLTAGLPLTDEEAADQAPVDSGEAEGLGPERLTVTIGFGAGLFHKDGLDRFGLAAHRPDALIDLPKFNGDQLLPEKTGGDLCVQACADNAQVAMHAARHLARIGYGVVQMRWAQGGFGSGARPGETPRNLMGFKDGTVNPDARDGAAMARYVWVGDEGGWMRGGSYLVARPIRISLDHWDRMKLAFQEQVVGRHKASGAPLGGTREFDPKKLDATDADGNFIIQENSHVRLGASETNDGAQILRRAYAYDNGLAHIAERWPPWRQGMFMDAGLMFLAWQRDPRSGFVKIFENMAKFDMMNQFVTHIGSGLFACPPGARPGGFVGETLFNA